MLIYKTDCFVLKNELNFWTEKGYDFMRLTLNDFLQLNYPAIKLLLSSLSLCSKQTRDFYLFKQEKFYP
jgi:hypothetical protein